MANSYEATFREQPGRVDNRRRARLIYHGDGDHQQLHDKIQCIVVVEVVNEGLYEGNRYLHLVFNPPGIKTLPPKKKVDKSA
jgi:hypothetical protein